MGLVPAAILSRTNGVRDLSKSCLWEQEGGPKCTPDSPTFCKPCLDDFYTQGYRPVGDKFDGLVKLNQQ
jgi:hypothetical protein